jgi:hypothetical protein
VAPAKQEVPVRAAGNGWYSPETVVSSRLIEAQPADYSIVDDAIEVIDPVVLPPEPNRRETAVSTRVKSDEERAEFAASIREQRVEPKTAGTRVRVNVETPAARNWGWAMALACAAVVLLAVILLRSLSTPRTNVRDADADQSASTLQPEDLSTANTPSGRLGSSKAANPVATPISTDSDSSRTTVAVRAPAALPKQEAPEAPATRPPAIPAPTVSPSVAPTATHPLQTQRTPAVRTVPTPPAPVETPEVELVSDPPGARVEVDGREDLSCLAPCSVPLPPGRHTLFAQTGGYGVARKIFSVPVSGSVFISLSHNIGTMLLTSAPSGASVSIDGKPYGPTPVRVRLSAGRHHLSVSDGNRHHEETIQIDADGMYARSFRW